MQRQYRQLNSSRGNRGRFAVWSVRGFTLLEMLLVLAVIAVALGFSYPAISRMYQGRRIRQAAELIQVRMMAARVHAVETGIEYQFLVEPDGRRFVAVPLEFDPEIQGEHDERTREKLAGFLPDTMRFVLTASAAQVLKAPPVNLQGMSGAELFQGANWSPAVTFYADGTATEGQVEIRDKYDQSSHVSVRPLTGGITIAAGN